MAEQVLVVSSILSVIPIRSQRIKHLFTYLSLSQKLNSSRNTLKGSSSETDREVNLLTSKSALEELKPESGIEVLIVLLYAPGAKGEVNEPIPGITRLDKLMFLLSKDEKFKQQVSDYQFEPYNYGPFATELFDDLEALIDQGIIERTDRKEPDSAIQTKDAEWIEDQTFEADRTSSWKFNPVDSYKLSPKGLIVGEKLFSGLTAKQIESVTKLKTRFNHMELRLLLRFVYQKYRDYAKKSKIAERILK